MSKKNIIKNIIELSGRSTIALAKTTPNKNIAKPIKRSSYVNEYLDSKTNKDKESGRGI